MRIDGAENQISEFISGLTNFIEKQAKNYIAFHYELKEYDNDSKAILKVNWLTGKDCKEIMRLTDNYGITVTILPEVDKIKFRFSKEEV